MQSSQALCESKFHPDDNPAAWTYMEQAPVTPAQRGEPRVSSDVADLRVTDERIREADLHWYKRGSDEVAVCIVLPPAKCPRAVFRYLRGSNGFEKIEERFIVHCDAL